MPSARAPWPQNHEYLFQMISGTKLVAKIPRKAIQKRLQLNEITDRIFKSPSTLRNGKKIPSILQWIRPHVRPLMRQPIPAQATATIQRLSSWMGESNDLPYANVAVVAKTAGTPHRM